jgi:hypothetical protein
MDDVAKQLAAANQALQRLETRRARRGTKTDLARKLAQKKKDAPPRSKSTRDQAALRKRVQRAKQWLLKQQQDGGGYLVSAGVESVKNKPHLANPGVRLFLLRPMVASALGRELDIPKSQILRPIRVQANAYKGRPGGRAEKAKVAAGPRSLHRIVAALKERPVRIVSPPSGEPGARGQVVQLARKAVGPRKRTAKVVTPTEAMRTARATANAAVAAAKAEAAKRQAAKQSQLRGGLVADDDDDEMAEIERLLFEPETPTRKP